MSGDDLAALLRWLYGDAAGGSFLGPASRDLRINERNLRAMLAGRMAVPETVGRVLCILAAAHSALLGWADVPAPAVSADTERELTRWREGLQ